MKKFGFVSIIIFSIIFTVFSQASAINTENPGSGDVFNFVPYLIGAFVLSIAAIIAVIITTKKKK